MKLLFTKPFIRDYRRLPQQIQKRVDKQLALLLKDYRHPSLKSRKMQDPRNIWEARITQAYRFTFQLQGDVYILRKVGVHNMLKNP